ncbi:hypothetical protein SDC9_82805 [bioreactor metagenome]|uniref:Uncharacterized protein n=1 Tax=bioreactor metagenome TaxID=1076179 RepID=A0A644Z5W6_9ZZZZ
MRQPYLLFGYQAQLGSQNNTTGMTAPRLEVEPGIVVYMVWRACIAKDGLHKIEVGNQRARSKEPYLHSPFGANTLYLGAYQRPQEKGNKNLGLFAIIMGEGQVKEITLHDCRPFQQMGCSNCRHSLFVVGDGQPSLGNMENPFGCPPVVLWVVQDTLFNPV